MSRMKKTVFIASILGLIGAGAAWAGLVNHRTPVEFFKGHHHTDDGQTVDAPQHSGGLDRYGCHNASVPYHCHR